MTELHIDMQRISPAIMKECEVRLGMPWTKALKSEEHQVDALWALAYAFGRRQDPSLTWEQAGEVVVYLETQTVPPTNASGSAPKRR